jgi:hypothetical protein
MGNVSNAEFGMGNQWEVGGRKWEALSRIEAGKLIPELCASSATSSLKTEN